MACKTVSVLGAATQQVAIPSRLPQTQSDWQTFTQQLNTLFSQLSTTARRPAATSVPIQYATLFSSTLPPLQITNCTVTADNSWSLFGGFSYKIVVTGSNASVVCGASGFPLPIPPNENWLLSVYGKCSGASQSFKMGLQTSNNTYENTVITDATATTVDRFAIPLNLVADDASQCTLRLDFPSAIGQTFWFDGFQYEPSVSGSINPSPFLSTNIIAGSIVAQFITVAQLSALSANMGTLTAGKIQSSDGRFTIDCTNELITITDGTNTRMQIGEVSAGVYDVKIWNGSGVLLFDAATGLQYAGNSTQVTQVINNNSGNGQLNVNPTGGVTSNLPHANQSNQTLQVIANNGGNGQLNVNPTGGVVSTLPYANHDVSVKSTIVSAPDGNGSYLGHGVVFQPHIHANQIGWGHFIGDTSGNYTGNLVDGLNLRFLHGAMSGPTQNTVAGTADGNGSYLQHGVVFNPHLTGGAVGWKNLLGDTSGDTTTNLIDAANKRFLHGAMSTGVQGVISSGAQLTVNPSGGVSGTLPYTNHDISFRNVISSGSQLNVNPTGGVTSTLPYANHDTSFRNVISSGSQLTVNPTGGVTGNLPYANHDVSVRTTLASTAGGDGSYLNTSQVFNRHLNQATQSGLADDATYLRQPARAAAANLLDNGDFESWLNGLPTGWMNGAGPGATPAAAITQDTSPYSGTYCAKITTDTGAFEGIVARKYFSVTPGKMVSVSLALKSDGVHAVGGGAWFSDETGAFKGTVSVPGVTSTAWIYQTATGLVPAGATRMYLAATGPNPGGSFSYWVDAFTAYLGVQTTNITGGAKAYADFTDNAAGGHIGKTQSNVADDSNAKMFRFGTLASRPAAGTAGRIYHASDAGTNGITYRDTGSAWVGMAVGHLADISGTLDNTSDGSSRFAVASVDPNKKALIDFSQPGHSNANIQYFGGIQSGTCYDGQAITFNPAYASIPLVIFSGGGMSYSSVTGSATTQSQAFTASSLTTSGFTASLKLVSGGTLTARSDNFTTVTSGSEYQATLTNAPAYNNTYTVNWTLSLNSSSSGTVYIRETNVTGTILFQKNYVNGQNGAKSTSVTWSGATGTSVIDISLVLTDGTGTISASTVTFTSGTAPSSVSAVPSTAPITWVAFPQT